MNAKWKPSLYRTSEAQTDAPASDAVAGLLQGAESCSAQIHQQPYEPEFWCKRAAYYLALNYPELAIGDAYKSLSLLKHATDYVNDSQFSIRASDAAHRSPELLGRIYDILGQALIDAHCHWEAEDTWQEAARVMAHDRYHERAGQMRDLLSHKAKTAEPIGGTPQEQIDRLKDGGVYTVHYPWMQEAHTTRSAGLVASINQELRENVIPHACYVGRSSLAVDSQHDMFGVFAARPLRKGECFLVDRTALGICSDPENACCDNCYTAIEDVTQGTSCCKVVYCSSQCYNIALNTYHKAICGKDFTWLLEATRGCQNNASPLRPLLMLRVLASCIQAGSDRSPLDHPLVARLQPLADCDHLDVFTLKDSVTTPIKILQQLDVDVYANHHFDTSVLNIIWTRLANNKAGAVDARIGFVDEVTPFLSLFNHSCGSNVEWQRDPSSTTVRFFARRDIGKDEELFSSYLELDNVGVEERMERLWPWFEGPCRCARCECELEDPI